MISRMDPDLYQRAGLDVKLKLDTDLSMDEIIKLEKAMKVVLTRIAMDASQIRDPSKPWLDNTSENLRQHVGRNRPRNEIPGQAGASCSGR